MMNTRSGHAVQLRRGRDYVFCNEDLELAFERADLNDITKQWNNGKCIHEIAYAYKRDPDEVFLALFHQAREGKIKRRFNYIESVKHLQVEKGIPKVINYEGRRYVHEPEKHYPA